MPFSPLASSAEVTNSFRVQYISDWSDNLLSGSKRLGVVSLNLESSEQNIQPKLLCAPF